MTRALKIQKVREKLNLGFSSIGSWMQIPNSSIAEIMGDAGYDWICVDLEHGHFGYENLTDIFKSIELGGALPIARLPNSDPYHCKAVLDAGGGGVIVPMVESAAQLASVRDSCRWPPAGKRGVGYSRANLFGKNFNEYAQDESQQPLLIAMIEHIKALENLDEILSTSGLDGILVGPYDLSASMNLIGQFDSEGMRKALKLIVEKCKTYSVPAGFHVVQPNEGDLKQKIREGYQFIAYGIDAIFLNNNCENPKI